MEKPITITLHLDGENHSDLEGSIELTVEARNLFELANSLYGNPNLKGLMLKRENYYIPQLVGYDYYIHYYGNNDEFQVLVENRNGDFTSFFGEHNYQGV